jgi:hypothetical protein
MDRLLNTKRVTTTLVHMQSVTFYIYIHTHTHIHKICPLLLLKSNNTGLCNWFLYIATCPDGHCPLLEKITLLKRILNQNTKTVWVYILCMIPCWWIQTPQAFPLYILSLHSKTNRMHNISNLFYFGTTLYMFRVVSPSIIRSLRHSIRYMYSLRLLIMDRETIQNM